jgi:hypothetical protein
MTHDHAMVFIPPTVPEQEISDWIHARLEPLFEVEFEAYDPDSVDDKSTLYPATQAAHLLDDHYLDHVMTPDGFWHSERFKNSSDWRYQMREWLDTYADHQVMLVYVNT